MWTLHRSALPIAVILFAPLTVSAQESVGANTGPNNGDVTVTASRDGAALTRWTSWVGRSITDNLAYPTPLGTANPPQGVVDIAFKCSDAGRPANVAVARSSGSPLLDKAALRAVQRVKTLHPLPDGMSRDQLYEARLMFALDDGTDTQRRMAALQRQADDGNGRLWARADAQAPAEPVAIAPAAALR